MSRWWGIVSTFYLVAAPILLLTGYHMLWDSRDPEAVKPVLYVVALLGPLPFGFILASFIESRRDPEPKLQLFDDYVLGFGRITLGFLVPVLVAVLIAFLDRIWF